MVGLWRHNRASQSPTSPAMASFLFSVEANAPTFPAALRQLARPPATLWFRGRLPAAERLVAVVGARAATSAGCRLAGRVAGEAGLPGYGVPSGRVAGV